MGKTTFFLFLKRKWRERKNNNSRMASGVMKHNYYSNYYYIIYWRQVTVVYFWENKRGRKIQAHTHSHTLYELFWKRGQTPLMMTPGKLCHRNEAKCEWTTWRKDNNGAAYGTTAALQTPAGDGGVGVWRPVLPQFRIFSSFKKAIRFPST